MSVESPIPIAEAPPPRRRRRWLRRLLGLLTLLTLLIAFAPVIVAHTPLRNRIARVALADLHGSIDVGGASLGWFSTVELRDVVIKDSEGRTLLTAAKITSSKSLISLVRNRADLGEFTIERPVLDVVSEKGSTNLEEAISVFLKDDGAPAGPMRTAIALHIREGTITLHEAGQASRFESVESDMVVSGNRDEVVTVKLATRSGGGTLAAGASLGTSSTATIQASDFPLQSLAFVVQRFAPSTQIEGRLTANFEAEWGSRSNLRVDGTAKIQNLDVSTPVLKGDRLTLASVELPLKLTAAGDSVRIERADLTCDVGTIALAGSFDTSVSLDQFLEQSGVKIDAEIDLALLAAKLPRLVRLREGVAVREGKLIVNVASSGVPTEWNGMIRASDLKGRHDGREIEWKEPFSIEFAGRFTSGQLPSFDKLICRSDFIAVNAQSNPELVRLGANINLDALTRHLADFADLSGASLSGTASLKLILKRDVQGAFDLDSALDLAGFAYVDASGKSFREEHVSLRAIAIGHAPAKGPIRLDHSAIDLLAGTDEFHLTQHSAIPDVRKLAKADLSYRLNGDFGRWIQRTRYFVRVPEKYHFAGAITASGFIYVTPESIRVERLTVLLDQVQFRGAGLNIQEPTMSAVADLSVNRSNGNAVFTKFNMTSEPLSVENGTLTFETQPNGELAVFGGGPLARTNLDRLAKTLKLATDPRGSDAFQGRGTGPMYFRNSGSLTTFNGTLKLEKFAYGRPEETGIAENELQLAADGKYDDHADLLSFNTARIERPGLVAEARGFFGKFATTQDVSLDGTLTYDLVKLTPELRSAIGGEFAATGTGSRPFFVKGSLAPGGTTVKVGAPPGPFSQLAANAGINWDSVKAYGFEMGPSELTGRLANGTLYVTPIKASFAGSQIELAPTVRLDPEPAEMTFARGKIVDRARLTPEALAGGLGYVLPAIASATQAEGELSIQLDESRIPLGDFSKATVAGQLVVHRATVSAGPLITELAQLLGSPPTQLTLANEMTVPVRIQAGRVYHENFSLNFNGIEVKTSGSVGFDGSLSLVADVPVPANLFKNNPKLMQALAGKRVKLPITGTVSKPVLDPRLFQAAVANLVRDAATDVGRDVLNKELEKIIPGGSMGKPGGLFPFPFKR